MRGLLLVTFLSSISGCVVIKIPQIDAVKGFMATVIDSQQAAVNNVPKWQVRVGDEGRIATAYTEGDFFVFASESSDFIVFDGWSVRSVDGFGRSTVLTIATDQARKQFREAKTLNTVTCGSWVQTVDNRSGLKTWSRDCEKQVRPDIIRLDEQGAISEINQAIDAEGTRAVLTRR